MRYGKICPRCGGINDEFADLCQFDGEFIGILGAEPIPDEPAAPPVQPVSITPAAPFQQAAPLPHAASAAIPALFLEVGGLQFPVRPNDVIGQDHPTGDSQVRLPRTLPDCNFVHRNHCSCRFEGGQWYVLVTVQPGPANPTFVNESRLVPGQQALLHNGDRLVLGKLMLTVRILQ